MNLRTFQRGRMETKFNLLIDASLIELLSDSQNDFSKKYLLSYLNEFESAKWRYAHFNKFLFDNLCETALSADERRKLPTDPYSAMVIAAKNLRLSEDNGQGSELAEILLYGIMKRHYGALPVVPKIYYKQNTQDNAKGADSVHVVLEGNGKFSLWYGESKFYNNLNSAMASAIDSIKDTITDGKLRKENSIVTSMRDLEEVVKDKELFNEIKTMLSPDTSLDKVKSILHIPILLLHECSITAQQEQMTQEYQEQLKCIYKSQAQKFFNRLNEKCSGIYLYAEITFHLILFPIPDKEQVVNRFIQQVNSFRED